MLFHPYKFACITFFYILVFFKSSFNFYSYGSSNVVWNENAIGIYIACWTKFYISVLKAFSFLDYFFIIVKHKSPNVYSVGINVPQFIHM